MTARILIIDDIPANIDLLRAKLVSNYYEVESALSGEEGIKLVESWHPDLILLDVMMPEVDGFEVCKRLRQSYTSVHIPIIMVTALDDDESRLKGLECGADDFLSKPINDTALLIRIKSLLRLKIINDELRLRYETSAQIDGSLGEQLITEIDKVAGSKVLIIEDDIVQAGQIKSKLKAQQLEALVCNTVAGSLETASRENPDLIIVDLQLLAEEGLKLCSHLKSTTSTRYTPILIVVDEGAEESDNLLLKGVEIGINDYITVPLDGSELLARSVSQIKRRKYQRALQNQMQQDVHMSTIDPLTGCFNRRYFDVHLENKVKQAMKTGDALSLALIDLDYFKAINDTHGHQEGDEALKTVVTRIKDSLRESDLVARYGGEEFIIIMPKTTANEAKAACERTREEVEASPVAIAPEKAIPITISIGIACMKSNEDRRALIARADAALYQAKEQGRNKVVCSD